MVLPAPRPAVRFAALALLALSGLAAEAQTADTPAPVTKVVLYKHGMGYFERLARVTDTATVSLAFRADQMKDLLTSFYAVDLGGGRISSVRYETRDPLSKQLQDIVITVPENAALSQFLMQLKGARITVRASGEALEGRILGTEPTSEVVGGQTVRQGYRLVLLTDAGPIRSVDLFGITEFSLADEALQRDLKRLLELTLDAKYTYRKKLSVTSTGQGEREVRLGYLVETPVWKTSYRVILDPKADGSAFLQGWAQAENTTEDDWNDVAISFVAGSPFSYVMDLYSPLYVKRPQVQVPGLQDLAVDWDQAPPPETGGYGVLKAERLRAPLPAPAPAARPQRSYESQTQMMDRVEAEAPAPEPAFDELLAVTAGTAAEGARVGELFSYTPRDRITVPRGQAALVPIVATRVPGRRVVYYKRAFSPKPTDAWVLQNDTELTLEAGAVTFFEGSTALGEGILTHTLPPGSQEVLAYAADASVDVAPQTLSQRQPYFQGRLVDGVLTVTRGETLATTWRLTNRGREAATLWLHQPKNAAYRLAKPEKPLKEVDGHYRFEVALGPGEARDFAVEERRDVQESVEIGHADEASLRVFASADYLSPATRQLLSDVGGLLAQKASLARQAEEWKAQAGRLSEEQGRLRQNVNTTSLGSPSEKELRAKWMSALSAAEDKLTALRAQLDEAGTRTRGIDEEIARRIGAYRGD